MILIATYQELYEFDGSTLRIELQQAKYRCSKTVAVQVLYETTQNLGFWVVTSTGSAVGLMSPGALALALPHPVKR